MMVSIKFESADVRVGMVFRVKGINYILPWKRGAILTNRKMAN